MSEFPKFENLPPIEYNPNHIDKIFGAIGRLTMRLGGEPIVGSMPTDVPLPNEVIDDLISRDLEGATLESQTEGAQLLQASFAQAPQLDRPLYLPGGIRGESSRVLAVKSTVAAPIKLPVRNFVHASAMVDWNRGRGDLKSGSTNGLSRSVIRQYARRSTPMPPIGHVAAYVQPDGRTLFSSVQDGGHRIAAAHLRGDASIAVGGTVIVHRLKQNILPK